MKKLRSYKDQFINYIHQLQNEICNGLEQVDGMAKFKEDQWDREGGGGGLTRVISNGNIFEKGGVNTSVVFGTLPESLKKHLSVDHGDFFACGLSLVIHPSSPMVPTVHANYRYFELYQDDQLADQWFGGGADLTPYYFWPEDASHFHQVLKDACDQSNKSYYPKFKAQCDQYFYNSHRQEARGIGGIFFDYLRPNPDSDWYQFVSTVGDQFLQSYTPIVARRKDEPFTESNRYWQEIRRGRYVEFNLIHDRGTLFGLKTNGRIESILMSLPPRARWDYNFHPEKGGREEQLLAALEPKDWVNLNQHAS